MLIDYLAESEKYRPSVIRTLLVGEAPPPSGTSYFYVPRSVPTHRDVIDDTSLPATIFHHYFGLRPSSIEQYQALLRGLQAAGVFLVDLCDDPIRVRGDKAGVERIIAEIPLLSERIRARGIVIHEEAMVFLLARTSYVSKIRKTFPLAKRFTWKHFRMNPEPCPIPCPWMS